MKVIEVKPGDAILVGDAVIQFLPSKGCGSRVGIDAPPSVKIHHNRRKPPRHASATPARGNN
jgi:sRNA-binding carbon storage regulator CsrA